MLIKSRHANRFARPSRVAGSILLIVGLLVSTAISAGATPPAQTEPGGNQGRQEPVGRYLVMENVGQYAAEARFLLKQGDQRVWLTRDAVWLTVPDPAPAAAASSPAWRRHRQPSAMARAGTALRFTFPGADPAAKLEPFGRIPTHVSYLLGNEPSRWRRNVPVWSGVRYRDLYPGIDLVIGGDATGTVPWRFEARPGADVGQVTMRTEGADTASVDGGQIRLEMKGRAVSLAAPAWFMEGQIGPATSAFLRQDGTDDFTVASESQAQLQQVPVAGAAGVAAAADLVYSTLLGGTAGDFGYAIAVDRLGDAYITGETQSDDFPVAVGSYDPHGPATTDPAEAFVAKFNAAGTALLYATYLGGADLDIGWGIAVGGVLPYVVGETQSSDFPGMTGSPAGSDIFVVALNADGSDVRYVSRLGGAGFDTGYGIAVQETDAYVVGTTYSTDLPGTGCAAAASGDLVVARFNALGAPAYTTCLGGSDIDVGYAIAARSGIAYVTGESWSDDFPGGSPMGANDVLVATFAANGTLSNSKLIGGTEEERGSGIAVDGAGNTYITGSTSSSADFPVTLGTWGGGSTDAVLIRVAANFTTDFAAYLGGDGEDYGNGIAIDTVQGLYVAGTTTSTNLPVTGGAYDEAYNSGMDVFVARMHLSSSAPNKITYATYLGGTREDSAYGVATDTGGHAFVTGSTESADFPTSLTAYDTQLGGSSDAFVSKLRLSIPPGTPAAAIATSGANAILTWPTVPSASKYQLFRSSQPYFMPGDWGSALPLSEPTGTLYSDTGALSSVGAYFYLVKAVSAAPEVSGSSNRVGKFTLQLVQGTN